MQIKQLLTKTANYELIDINDQPTGVKITFKNAEDKIYRQFEHEELLRRLDRPLEDIGVGGVTKNDWIIYGNDLDRSNRALLAARVIKIDGLDDFDNTRESIDELFSVLPEEYILQFAEYVNNRRNFF